MTRMVRLGLAGIVGFSDKPLYLAVTFGFGAMGLAVLGLIFVILSIIFSWGDLVRGWASVVVAVMFFSAVQLIFLGVVGLYISRIFVEAKQRPLYVVKADSNDA
jgi:dolichol-phosphate mannosyltransferase